MAKFRVERDCYGFKGLYYRAGDVVDLSSKEKPPRHFGRIGKNDDAEKPPEESNPSPSEK